MNTVGTDTIDVAYVARLARLDLTEDEIRSFQAQLREIVGYVRKVQELDVSSVEPMSHVIPVENVFRSDEAREGLTCESALANAPAQRDGQFVVPRIME